MSMMAESASAADGLAFVEEADKLKLMLDFSLISYNCSEEWVI